MLPVPCSHGNFPILSLHNPVSTLSQVHACRSPALKDANTSSTKSTPSLTETTISVSPDSSSVVIKPEKPQLARRKNKRAVMSSVKKSNAENSLPVMPDSTRRHYEKRHVIKNLDHVHSSTADDENKENVEPLKKLSSKVILNQADLSYVHRKHSNTVPRAVYRL